ncbi:MAG: redox-regulated ATPase YchF [Magnetococcales bacterium]|nr:redox-regulated ATPase YchF [Magnetococcales bacterium]MBF0155607.1 redox-regulated ATPase YchF [Magnetococcales bacterium]
MALKCGIVGLPNVGKSTIFNALTAAGAPMANYPFCTIEPNVGVVAVPDGRLAELGRLNRSASMVPTAMEFLDIAGLVKGASKGEGLGNQFLGHIRQVDAIAHVVRCFEGTEVTHVHGRVDPVADIEVIETELLLADLGSAEKRLEGVGKKARIGDKESKREAEVLEKVVAGLNGGVPVRRQGLGEEELAVVRAMFFLTLKPVLYVCNVSEGQVAGAQAAGGDGLTDAVRALAAREGAEVVAISGAMEAEIAELEGDEKGAFLRDLGLESSGLDRMIGSAYRLLGLLTFFTAGPKESRAWTVTDGATAYDAAGVIHTDFQKGFIRAEVIGYGDYVAAGGEKGAKELGKMRLEGREYRLVDGDVIYFRFNV